VITPIFIIESGVVSGMLTKKTLAGKPEIVYYCSFPLPFQETLDAARLDLAVTSSLDKAAEELAHKGLAQIGKINLQSAVIVISAPWYTSENKCITTSNKQPFKVKDVLIDQMIVSEVATFEKERGLGDAFSVIEKRITEVKLNGYPTAVFKDKKALELEFCLYISIVDSKFKQKMDETVHKYFGKGLPSWHTMPLALFGALLSSTPESKDFMIVEVGGEITEIMVIKNKVLVDTISFPYGVNSFLRKTTETLHEATAINASLYKQYGENTLTGELKDKVDQSLVMLKNEWGGELGKALHKVSGGLLLPKSIYLKCGSDFKMAFRKCLEEEGFAQIALSEAPFEIHPVDHHMLISIFISGFDADGK
jgi:hypothetical protein